MVVGRYMVEATGSGGKVVKLEDAMRSLLQCCSVQLTVRFVLKLGLASWRMYWLGRAKTRFR